MTSLFGVFLAFGIHSVVGQSSVPSFVLNGPSGTIVATNFQHVTSDIIKGEYELSGTGDPVTIQDSGSGLTLSARSIKCTLVRDQAGIWTVSHADLAGQSVVDFDSGVSNRTRQDIAKRNKKPIPGSPSALTVSHLSSEAIKYAVVRQEAVITFEHPFNYRQDSLGTRKTTRDGKSVEDKFSETIQTSGQRGEFVMTVVAPRENKDPEPKTAHVEGTVHFSIHRTETPIDPTSAAVPKITDILGTGDKFDADFVGATDPTLTLDGNVKVDGSDTGFTGTVTGNRAIVTLDRLTREPKRYEFLGQPATTVLTPIPVPTKGKNE